MKALRAAAIAFALFQPCLADEKVFLEAMKATERSLYDKDMQGVDWAALRDELREKARAAQTDAESSAVINEALSRLNISHLRHCIPLEREYFELLDVFHDSVPKGALKAGLEPGPVRYTGVGLVATRIGGKVFAADVYDGGPAAKAGIFTGDELVSVNGEEWSDIEPFEGKRGEQVTVTIRRDKDGPTRDVTVIPATIQPRRMFLRAMRAGARLIQRDETSMAYVRVRSYASESYQQLLASLLTERFEGADGLILDLRGGWGGAQAEYMNLFGSLTPSVQFRHRGGDWSGAPQPATWTKPMVVLIDSGTRSGKEILAHAFKKSGRATLVGTRTAGAVLGGSARILSDGSLLLIAVADVRVDGESLEGVGVEPDEVVQREIPYAAGEDPQLDRAVSVLYDQLNAPPRAPGR